VKTCMKKFKAKSKPLTLSLSMMFSKAMIL